MRRWRRGPRLTSGTRGVAPRMDSDDLRNSPGPVVDGYTCPTATRLTGGRSIPNGAERHGERGKSRSHAARRERRRSHGPDTRLTVRRGTSQDVVKVFRTSFPPARQFVLPAFPTEQVLTPFIEPSRYRSKPLPFFTLTNGKTITRNVTVFREPSEWDPAFTKWNALSDRFDPLKEVLEDSPGLRVRGAPRSTTSPAPTTIRRSMMRASCYRSRRCSISTPN